MIGDGHGALRGVLCEVAHAFKIFRNTQVREELVEVSSHRLPLGDDNRRSSSNVAAQRVELSILLDHALGACNVTMQESADGVVELRRGKGTHGLDACGQRSEL